MASIKSMAALFTAFDRPTYQRLIEHHISDMANCPKPILKALRDGAFSVSITGRPTHSVAIDEAHEMCVNKDCKQAITRPNADNIDRTSKILPLRSKGLKNLDKELFPERSTAPSTGVLTLLSSSDSKKLNENIRAQETTLFTGKPALPEVAADLLKFRLLGQEEFETHVQYNVLKQPSTVSTLRKKRLLTFTEPKVRKRKCLISKKSTNFKQSAGRRGLNTPVKLDQLSRIPMNSVLKFLGHLLAVMNYLIKAKNPTQLSFRRIGRSVVQQHSTTWLDTRLCSDGKNVFDLHNSLGKPQDTS